MNVIFFALVNIRITKACLAAKLEHECYDRPIIFLLFVFTYLSVTFY